MKTISYNNLQEVWQEVSRGVEVHWASTLYIVKIDMDGDLVVRSISGGGELLTDEHLRELFTLTK